MSLRDINFRLSYNSRKNDLLDEFYIPCFMNSIKYERAVGFFTSGILAAVSHGLNEFLANHGTMKLICSPQFSQKDIEAIEKGYKKRDAVIAEAIMREIECIPADILDDDVNFLSWLISVDRLDIRVALPEHISSDSYGIYHEKIGLFWDQDGNAIAFSGSNNETLGGLTYNYESFDVYKSWADNERCYEKAQHFKDLWENVAYGVQIYTFPEAAKKRIVEKINPQEHPKIIRHPVSVKKRLKLKEFIDDLWYFQKEAVEAYRTNNFSGIFSMATGTGKTKTAIGAMIELKKETGNLFAIIVAPQNTILRQWENDIDSVDLVHNSVFADSTNINWDTEMADSVIDFNSGVIDGCIIYTTYNTLSSKKFVKLASSIKKDSLLICDEVHWSGADTFQNGLIPNIVYRLGLSATPKRYMDDEGSDLVMRYFGKIVYEFSLERALNEINPVTGLSFLCQYNYYPIFVGLNSKELEKYAELSEKIRRQYAKEAKHEKISTYLERLYEERQDIIINAASKYESLDKLLDSMKDLRHILVYCSPQQIDHAQDILNIKAIKNHRFTGEEKTTPKKEYHGKSERDYILENFENGTYIALVAMKCLDEGINVLRAENGILMASTGNPKQYIQRRGRLLRRHKEKDIVNIYDIITLPYLNPRDAEKADQDEQKILEKECIRYEEFASLANNKLYAMNKIFDVKKMYAFYKAKKEVRNVSKLN